MASTFARLSITLFTLGNLACPSQQLEDSVTSSKTSNARAEGRIRNIAIIGAGSAGASTAYYLQKYHDASTTSTASINITVFERSDYIGGRSTTVNVWNDADQAVELGASIFVKPNRNLYDAAVALGLPIQDAGADQPNEAPHSLGVWDGDAFRYVESARSSYWWDVGRLVWTYGLAPFRTQRLMLASVKKVLALYEVPIFPFRSLDDAVVEAGLIDAVSVTGTVFLEKNGIGSPFSTDLIQASTRVNYAQNLGEIHGLETMVCMATQDAMSIAGGNWQIFKGMLESARANVLLNSSVSSISKAADSTYTLTYETTNGPAIHADFDDVVIAAPLQFTDITIDPPLSHLPAPIPYVDLHVTLFASPHHLSPIPFGLPLLQPPPETILTTLPNNQDLPHDSSTYANAPSGFFSISTLRKLSNAHNHSPPRTEYLYKIFSPRALNATLLASLLGFQDPAVSLLADIPAADVSWLYEQVWNSYPYEVPRRTFDAVALDAGGLWYTAGMEGLISAMETSSLAGMNVARLIVDRWAEEEEKEEAEEEKKKKQKKPGEQLANEAELRVESEL